MNIKQDKKLSLIIKIIAIVIFFAITTALTIWLVPQIITLTDAAKRAQFMDKISSMGIGGWFAMLGIQVLQIVVALIPGEPIEIIAGFLYGGLGGLFTCLLGILIGSAIVFFLVKKIGYPLVNAFVSEEKMAKYKFLNDETKLELFTFILFLIPGTPKDVLTYIAGLTKIHPIKFLTIATLSRIPSIITSTYAGSSLGKGNFGLVILMFVIAAILGVAGIIINNKFLNKQNKNADKK